MHAGDLRHKYPTLTEEQLRKVAAMLNKPAASVRDIWAGENQVNPSPQAIGPDGLTRPQRQMNEFAEKHGLPGPFPFGSNGQTVGGVLDRDLWNVLRRVLIQADKVGRGSGGRCEIRTHEGREPLPVFKTGALDRSANLPSNNGSDCEAGELHLETQ